MKKFELEPNLVIHRVIPLPKTATRPDLASNSGKVDDFATGAISPPLHLITGPVPHTVFDYNHLESAVFWTILTTILMLLIWQALFPA